MIAKLVHDNELLMGEVQALDQTLRETREAYSQLRQEKAALEASSTTGQRLLDTVGEQAALDRRERERDRQSYEALAAQHAADKEFLNTVFRELEEQLAIARTEREETQSRAERERRASLKRTRELEEAMREKDREALALRAQCNAEKEALVKQFEQRIAGLRLEKDQARLEKQVLRRLERDVGELKSLALGSREARRWLHAGPEELEHAGGGEREGGLGSADDERARALPEPVEGRAEGRAAGRAEGRAAGRAEWGGSPGSRPGSARRGSYGAEAQVRAAQASLRRLEEEDRELWRPPPFHEVQAAARSRPWGGPGQAEAWGGRIEPDGDADDGSQRGSGSKSAR